MKGADLANKLFDKYKDSTEGLFLNSLWQILVNGCRANVQSAFVYVYVPAVKGGVNVGIADLNVSGYTPATFSFKADVPEKIREDIIDDLNSEVFGITPKRAFEIELSSMRKGNA